MHELSTSFVLGYHGCDRQVAEALLNGKPFKKSENDYDWLGHGIYFWESNPHRGLEFARELMSRSTHVTEPAVVGAVIQLGFCLDLMSSAGIKAVQAAHEQFEHFLEVAGGKKPRNSMGNDLLLRKLDCGVINHLHQVRERVDLAAYDSVRGVFLEGDRIYENSGFFAKTHVQICVRNVRAIKGVFRVPNDQLA